MGSQPAEFDEFAACLRALKERADLSYDALARRTRIGRSSLHRYCSGSHVPQDYGSAHRFATACGASPEELRRLHRLWALADAAREPDRGTDITDMNVGVDADADADAVPEAAPALGPSRAPAPADEPAPRSPWHPARAPALAVLALVLALGATAWGIAAVSGTGPVDGTADADKRPLFSAECAGPVRLGQRGACVREVQRLLARAGAEMDVDGDFGPQTLRRVTAFQALSRIDADGVVGEETKKALYAPRGRMETWPPGKVRQRVRKVFREVPDDAVALADCQSFLDPFHIVPNTDGTRNWGVFQISDAALRKLGGTPRDALDPEWNIQAAHRLWNRTKGFGDWPHCDRASSPEAVGPALVSTVNGRASDKSEKTVCPVAGQRFKTPHHDRVYLVGPGDRLYYVPDATVYFNLWDDWNGVAVVSDSVFADCAWDEAHELANGLLARVSGDSRAYIWDAWYGYRLITDRTVFDKYGFSAAKIQTRPSLSPISGDSRWR
ncbi:helix-turn-helix domain-containing protein [Streptomyces caeruleatus]|uniref:helix-turn-helix domain-containing protein n=1 Tax=Streptomyces caeruleatus TaxID=661399 RepID=UPI0007C63FC2|nr:helix-turn-helix domain-containing protein [Streptomyces caeruleatus]